MAVLIEDMDMPNTCSECRFLTCGYWSLDFCILKGNKEEYEVDFYKRPEWCPLKEAKYINKIKDTNGEKIDLRSSASNYNIYVVEKEYDKDADIK